MPSLLFAVLAARAQDAVLFHDPRGIGTSDGITEFRTAVTGAGASRVDRSRSWPSSLSDYRLVLLLVPSSSYSASETSDLQGFVDGGGLLVLVGENQRYYSATAGVLNSLLSSLGATSSFASAGTYDSACSHSGTLVASDSLTDGVSTLEYAYSGDVSAGSNGTLLVEGESGQGLVVVEDSVVLVSDSNVFTDSCGVSATNSPFWENLFEGRCATPDRDVDGYDASACGGTDCDDSDDGVHPGVEEVCDGADNDCDGSTDGSDAADPSNWFLDADGDGYGDAASVESACDAPSGYVAGDTDCDDDDATVSPGAPEACDGVDDDCDGEADEDLSHPDDAWYADADGDGYGDAATETFTCSPEAGTVQDDQDCDDADAATNPSATEVCDRIDNDCDGSTDPSSSADATTWYADRDGDGYGDSTSSTIACEAPSETVADSSDCDDRRSDTNPAATEICDSRDNDCDGTSDEADAADASTWYDDDDSDGYGDASDTEVACDQPRGHVSDATDCDDGSSLTWPGALERCDGEDNDCNGVADDDAADADTWYADLDSDGYGAGDPIVACDVPSGAVGNRRDCDPEDPTIHPGATEVCDGADNDCDGTSDGSDADDASVWYEDQDGDGYGDEETIACDQPAGSSTEQGDCDDLDPTIHPAATELCNGRDEDCDGVTDGEDAVDSRAVWVDADGDGHGDPSRPTATCGVPDGYSALDDDCDDDDPVAWAGVGGWTETCEHDAVDASVAPDPIREGATCGCASGAPGAAAWPMSLAFLAVRRRQSAGEHGKARMG